MSAFIAFPAVVWLCFFWEERWSCFRITQQVATVGLVLMGVGAIRAHEDFVGPDWSVTLYVVSLIAALSMLVALQLAMDRRVPRPSDNLFNWLHSNRRDLGQSGSDHDSLSATNRAC